MRRLTILGIFLTVLSMSCGSDSSGQAGDTPPWGLDQIDMPDTVEEVQAMISAFPDEIDGRVRSGGGIFGGSAGVMYGENPVHWLVQVQPTEQIELLGLPGVSTPTDYVEGFGSMMALNVEDRALTGNLLWVAANQETETLPGKRGTEFALIWAEPDGDFAFVIQAGSEAGRVALVEAFITAAGG